MILVTVGTHNQPFDRLVKAADELAQESDQEVIIQRGVTAYTPRYATSFPFTTSSRMEQLVRAAAVVVSHAAAGAIILALTERRPLVLTPRLPQFGEAHDDHQTQLARALGATSMAVVVYHPTPHSLSRAIRAASRQTTHHKPAAHQLIAAVERQLAAWEAEAAGSLPNLPAEETT
jgi:UDP-N-acetylglucosamine transferase subunit ALG13